MRTPLVVVTGVEATAMDTTMMSLSWDLPRAVVVRQGRSPDAVLKEARESRRPASGPRCGGGSGRPTRAAKNDAMPRR